MEEVRAGRVPFSKLDVLHRRNLDRILPRFKISHLEEDVVRDLNLAWHRLDGWPDVAPGLAQLRKRHLLAPVSNGNISLMVDLARRNTFPWDAILGAETAGDYKPKPRVYLAACAAFDLPPGECMWRTWTDLPRTRRPLTPGTCRAWPCRSGPGPRNRRFCRHAA